MTNRDIAIRAVLYIVQGDRKCKNICEPSGQFWRGLVAHEAVAAVVRAASVILSGREMVVVMALSGGNGIGSSFCTSSELAHARPRWQSVPSIPPARGPIATQKWGSGIEM